MYQYLFIDQGQWIKVFPRVLLGWGLLFFYLFTVVQTDEFTSSVLTEAAVTATIEENTELSDCKFSFVSASCKLKLAKPWLKGHLIIGVLELLNNQKCS